MGSLLVPPAAFDALVCLPGDAWDPVDAYQCLAAKDLTERAKKRGFTANHFSTAEVEKAEADRLLRPGDEVHIDVLHSEVDPSTRVCQNCGTQVGKPRGALLARLRRR